ncbi:MAG: hypothetical protein CMF39_02960 [Legionellaceae bacterium]|nr:hypothetical protein [Legionellaceae bacterium]
MIADKLSDVGRAVKYPCLGFGLGLRAPYIPHILAHRPQVDWFEIISENFLYDEGRARHTLEQIRQHYPIVMHGVSLSVGSSDPLDMDYIHQLKTLADQFEVSWLSDHLCWSSIGQTHLHDLLPLPYTEETVEHVVSRIKQVQDVLERRILLENVSSYVTYKASVMQEWTFYREIVERSDCLMLLDINNIFVSAHNHGFAPEEYLAHMPADRVQQIHLAGHHEENGVMIDTHDHAVIDPVWTLYQQAIEKFGLVSTMIERDDRFPAFQSLLDELAHAKQVASAEVSV